MFGDCAHAEGRRACDVGLEDEVGPRMRQTLRPCLHPMGNATEFCNAEWARRLHVSVCGSGEACMETHTHTQMYPHTHPRTQARNCACSLTHLHTHRHKHTHTHKTKTRMHRRHAPQPRMHRHIVAAMAFAWTESREIGVPWN